MMFFIDWSRRANLILYLILRILRTILIFKRINLFSSPWFQDFQIIFPIWHGRPRKLICYRTFWILWWLGGLIRSIYIEITKNGENTLSLITLICFKWKPECRTEIGISKQMRNQHNKSRQRTPSFGSKQSLLTAENGLVVKKRRENSSFSANKFEAVMMNAICFQILEVIRYHTELSKLHSYSGFFVFSSKITVQH